MEVVLADVGQSLSSFLDLMAVGYLQVLVLALEQRAVLQQEPHNYFVGVVVAFLVFVEVRCNCSEFEMDGSVEFVGVARSSVAVVVPAPVVVFVGVAHVAVVGVEEGVAPDEPFVAADDDAPAS